MALKLLNKNISLEEIEGEMNITYDSPEWVAIVFPYEEVLRSGYDLSDYEQGDEVEFETQKLDVCVMEKDFKGNVYMYFNESFSELIAIDLEVEYLHTLEEAEDWLDTETFKKLIK